MNGCHTVACLALLLTAWAGLAGPLTGQAIEGLAVDHETGVPLEGVRVVLLGDDGAVAAGFSDAEGRFRVEAPAPGWLRMTAERLGYATVVTEPITVPETGSLFVELRLAVKPVTLEEPLRVIGRPAHVNIAIEQFRRRREQGEQNGPGYFLGREELELHGSARLSDVLRSVPGVRTSRTGVASGQILRMRAGCIPAVFLDGMHLNRVNWKESLDHYVDTRDVEGIEVYRGSESAAGFRDPNSCGVILVWTRNRSTEPDTASGWSHFALGVGLVIALLALR